MGGPFMVEIVFCRVTRRGRKLKKGMNKAGRANMRNDGPSQQFIPPDDTVKITLDLSENGPVFGALDSMMMKLLDDENDSRGKGKKGGGGGGGGQAKKALKSLLKSGIPGIEKMFSPGQGPAGKKTQQKGFHKMTDASKKKFMKAIFGEDGTAIETGTAAALLAAICSGGDPEIGDKIAQLLVPELGDQVDPAMMAALMAGASMINAGAGMEEVLKIMKAELMQSGMSEEEIFRKTQLLMQSFGKEDTGSLAEYSLTTKQKNSALKQIAVSPKEFSQIVLLERAISACGSTPENMAKVIMIENQLSKRGAQNRHISDALRKLADGGKLKNDAKARLKKVLSDSKMRKGDVLASVGMQKALDSENDPSWKEIKNMKDMLSGASPNSPEAIELNLNRATKTAGLTKADLTQVLLAQKVMAALDIDPICLAQVMNIQKMIAENGVPAVEIARVLSDGVMPASAHGKLSETVLEMMDKDFNANDVEAFVKLYDNIKLKSNVPEETIEHIDKTLIQVRCSLEDVADNLISSLTSQGEQENVIVRNLCETLKETGASVEIVGTTMMGALTKALPKPECEVMIDTGRSLTDVGYEVSDVENTMVEIMLNVLDENAELRGDAVKAVETVLTEAGRSPDAIQLKLDEVLPPDFDIPNIQIGEGEDECKNMAAAIMERNGLGSGASSRRGSLRRSDSISLGGKERRGSFYSEDVSKRSSVAIVVDDPENKKNMEKALNEVFNEGFHEVSTTSKVDIENENLSQHNTDHIGKSTSIESLLHDGKVQEAGHPADSNGSGINEPDLTDSFINVTGIEDINTKPEDDSNDNIIDDGVSNFEKIEDSLIQSDQEQSTFQESNEQDTQPRFKKLVQTIQRNVKNGDIQELKRETGTSNTIDKSDEMQVEFSSTNCISLNDSENVACSSSNQKKSPSKSLQRVDRTINFSDEKDTVVSEIDCENSEVRLSSRNNIEYPNTSQQQSLLHQNHLDNETSSISSNPIMTQRPNNNDESFISTTFVDYDTSDSYPAFDMKERNFYEEIQEKEEVDPIKKLLSSFDIEGKVHHIGGVCKFRTVDQLKDTVIDTEEMFNKALEDAMNQVDFGNGELSDGNRELMEKLLQSEDANEEMKAKISAMLAKANSGEASTRDTKVKYMTFEEARALRSKRPVNIPEDEPVETYRHPASLGIGVVGTGNQRLVRRRVKRNPFSSRFQPLEEQREAAAQTDQKRIVGLKRAKVPLMVYSCGGFTRCYRIARLYTVDGPPIGIKYNNGEEGQQNHCNDDEDR